ncbi:ubiquitin-2 like Rad60 SUMO-like-domain-containing protein [Aspergillus bertholletiae]|uniref:Ubiquitin-2 like Rad60 SUMO-like-domain-containing protein n=1 Tax=Aspergillus bertholletiae TaxID=1226010 RepID=A0A5N7B439_9EURO|nr:ubiquitin-2 like Rad60 SUMO-like-domain-containing protein [Aspergillus bertholletiae]
MRSFFNRPSWATRGDDDDLDSIDFYRRAGQTYTDIIGASKEARDSSLDRSSSCTTQDGKVCKRRHILHEQLSRETTSRALPEDGEEKGDIQGISLHSLDSCKTLSDISDRNDCRTSVQLPTDKLTAVADSEVDSSNIRGVQQTHSGPYSGANAEITRTKKAVDKTPVSCDPLKNQRKVAIHTDQHPDSTEYDTVVQILITSKIQNTKPLIVHRKMSQSLRDVRLAWCNRQSIPKEMQPSILLTWKGRRLFDVTTCRSLGISMPKGLTASSVYGDHIQHDSKHIRIHMEAVIEDNIMAMDDWQASDERYSVSAQECTATDSSSRLLSTRVVLKCPSSGDMELNVSPRTHVSQLVTIFCDAKQIPKNREVFLVFDGDRLVSTSCLSTYDIADGDLVDVVIK